MDFKKLARFFLYCLLTGTTGVITAQILGEAYDQRGTVANVFTSISWDLKLDQALTFGSYLFLSASLGFCGVVMGFISKHFATLAQKTLTE